MRDLSDRANHVSSYTSPLPRAPYRVEGASMDKAIVSQQPEHVRFSGALAPLNNPNYRLLLLGFAIGQMIMPLQFITQILWVQHFAPADIWLILVALIAACRGLGAFCFGLYGGALADRFNRKHLLIFILVLQMIGTLLIAALMMAGDGSALSFVLFFVMTFLTSGLQSIDAPTRLALLPDVVGPALTPAGMSLNQVAGQVAMPLAMMMTGFLIHQFDFGGAYLISALGLASAALFILVMPYTPEAGQVTAKKGDRYGLSEAVSDIRIGLGFARHHPVILWLIVLLVVMMSFAYPPTASFGPTWVTTVVEVPIRDMGFVVMFWGVGSLAGAVLMARLASFERRGLLIGIGAVLFSMGFLVFVAGHQVWNVVLGNTILGMGMTMTMVSSTILIQHLAPNEVRGRVMSIFQLNMAFAQLMTMPVALLGQWLTLQVLFPWLAVMTLVMVSLILVTQRQIIRSQIPRMETPV